MSVSRECNWIITLTSGFFQIKIENICLFRVIKKHGNVFKNWLCPNFLLLPKNLSRPKFGGAAAPLAPPVRTPMGIKSVLLLRSSCIIINVEVNKKKMRNYILLVAIHVPGQLVFNLRYDARVEVL